jgi:hypothetical protein
MCGLAASCDVPRPPGAYDPIYDAGDHQRGANFDSADASQLKIDAGQELFTGSGTGDSGVRAPSLDSKFADIVGAYLMRIDDFSSASTTVTNALASVEISLKSRVSYLGVAFLSVDPSGRLVSRERLCHQTYALTCTEGCVSGQTVTKVYSGADKLFITVPPTTRNLTLSDSGQLTATSSSLFAGFDATSDASLPASNTDARVWDSDPDLAGKEGLFIDSVLVASTLGVTRTAECQLSTVQELKSSWQTVLTKRGDSFILHGQTIHLDRATTHVTSKLLNAAGYQDAMDADCRGDSAGGTSQTNGELLLRFFKVDPSIVRTACPTEAFYESNLGASPP